MEVLVEMVESEGVYVCEVRVNELSVLGLS